LTPPFEFLKVQGWIRAAGDIALRYYQTQLNRRQKDDLSPVTEADHAVEKFLIAKIQHHYPGHAIISEESGSIGPPGEFIWVIDPIDGTRVFIDGLPLWCISVGLLRQGEAYRGIVYLPVLNEIYYTDDEGVVFWNERPLKGLMQADWTPDSFMGVPSEIHTYFDIDFGRLRAFGSAVAHQVYVARGAAAAAFQRRLSLWDVAAAQAILLGAGGIAIYLDGRPVLMPEVLQLGRCRGPVLVGHPQLVEKLLPRIKPKSSTAP
jgi:fructose-1,6-bisphosphatase/inositol monophosphatase family enzyme